MGDADGAPPGHVLSALDAGRTYQSQLAPAKLQCQLQKAISSTSLKLSGGWKVGRTSPTRVYSSSKSSNNRLRWWLRFDPVDKSVVLLRRG